VAARGGGGGHTAATVCTQFGHQCQSAVDACPTRLCGGGGEQFAARATPATVCTQSGPQCPSVIDQCPTRLCGGAVGAAAAPGAWPTPATRCFVCPPRTFDYNCNVQQAAGGEQFAARVTPATVCTQSGPQCPSVIDQCPTRLCGGGGAVGAAAAPGAWPTPQTRCFVCDPVAARGGAVTRPNTAATVCTQSGPGCHTYPNGDCTFFGCGPGGGGGRTAATVCTQFGQQCQSAVDACPTRLCNQQAVGTWPTPMTRCFIC
ncbi:MAG TPA: hypothetical protein VFP80_17235, partial [Thermoanaerobaculia bacterium]|nr:hypothetical protein [Thermoanaerobaculia bacterium]